MRKWVCFGESGKWRFTGKLVGRQKIRMKQYLTDREEEQVGGLSRPVASAPREEGGAQRLKPLSASSQFSRCCCVF